MDITGIAKSHQTGIQKTGKASSKKDWKLSDSLREKITEYAREDAAQNGVEHGGTLRSKSCADARPNDIQGTGPDIPTGPSAPWPVCR